ncbi:two-component sensor histidine kinase BarA [Colwelliaceae bacterium BS250]
MNKVSLREWVLFLTLFPTLIIGVLLGAFFASERYSEIEQDIDQRASIISHAISQSAADAIETTNFLGINHLANILHGDNPDFVRSIMVFNGQNTSILTTSQRFSPSQLRYNKSDLELLTQYKEPLNGGYILYMPIRHQRPTKDGSPTFERLYGYLALVVSKQSLVTSLYDMLFISFMAIMVALILCSLFARKMMRMISRPIKDMNQAVMSVREGVLSARSKYRSKGEIELLRVGINNMAQAIEDYQLDLEENIDQATIDLRETLALFEVQNVELDLQRKKAQDASRVKSEFLANMSHELRTPLNGVLGFTKQILKTPLSDNQREFLNTIDGSANNLLTIINDILDFSKLDSGHMQIESIPYNFRTSIDEVITLLAQQAHQKSLEFSIAINSKMPNSLIGDAMRIKQVLINLIGNAIKFTDKGSVTIDINYELLDDSKIAISAEIRDTGIGINEEQQATLFEAFGQADNSITRLYGGTGLGLIIAKHLANEMEGDITLTSTANKGSAFVFKFLCELNQLPIDDIDIPNDLVDKEILYFEPHSHTRLATLDILESWKMNVTCITTLNEFSLKQHSKQYDVALLGFSVTATNIDTIKDLIHGLKDSVQNTVLAINNNSLNLKETFLNSGASACISKPLTATILAKYLSKEIKDSKQKRIDFKQVEKLPIKVLAVDDNEANLKLITTLLADKVEEIATATNGQEAVLRCQKEKFATIFMDVQMPIMDGVTAVSIIKTNSLNIDTDIIAVTAHALQGEKEKLIEAGFDGYMTKPIDETMLTHLLYEHTNIDKLNTIQREASNKLDKSLHTSKFANIFDWSLALNRAGNRPELAAEMLVMLVSSLADTKYELEQSIKFEDLVKASSIVHKLNGACCYNGVPRLEKIGQQIELHLKQNSQLEDIEPEFLELFDEIDIIINAADEYFVELHINQLLSK